MKKKNKIEQENQKIVKKIIIGVVIYGIFMAALILKLGFKEEEIELNSYLIIDDVYFYQYVDNKIKPISVLDTNYDDYIFEVYSDNEFSGTFYVVSAKYEYVNFRKKGSSGMYKPQAPYIAVTQNMEVLEYQTKNLTTEDINDLTNMMLEKEVYDLDGINYSYKVSIDLDADDSEETVYVVSNYNYMDIPEIAFSIVYVEDENGVTILEENYVTSDEIMNLVQYSLKSIVDLSGEEKYTLIVSSSDYDETELSFYEATGNNYKNITSN